MSGYNRRSLTSSEITMFDLFAITSQHTQSAVLEVPVSEPEALVYFGGSNLPNPPPPKLYLGGSQLPNPPAK